MISIIICSRKADIPQELKDNIASTIGCEYELCVIDNSHNEYNIFTAYNEGVRRAKGDILCFMHEDILFRSEKWGCVLEESYNRNPQVGCIGVVGVQYLPNQPLAMWNASPGIGGVMQGQRDKNGNYFVIDDLDPDLKELSEVVALDGCFITIGRELFHDIEWDDARYVSFHIYDMDICMQILNANYKVCVTPNIIIEHQSLGTPNNEWFDALQVFYEKWHDKLPISRGISLTTNELKWRDYLYCIIRDNQKLQKEIDQIHQSKSYQLGNALLKPFKWLRGVI